VQPFQRTVCLSFGVVPQPQMNTHTRICAIVTCSPHPPPPNPRVTFSLPGWCVFCFPVPRAQVLSLNCVLYVTHLPSHGRPSHDLAMYVVQTERFGRVPPARHQHPGGPRPIHSMGPTSQNTHTHTEILPPRGTTEL
jgi:hypothetical protein